MVSKYVKNGKEGAKGTDHAHKHKHTQGRKVREDGDKSKGKHGVKPPPHLQTRTRSCYRGWPRTTGKQWYGEQVC